MAKTDTSMSRRGFVQASVASAALLGLAGCAPENKVVETEDGGGTVYRLDPELDPEVEGAWIPAACWHNCGGRCANYAYVSDGVVLRQKTDDYHEDSWESPQQRSCPRGHSQQWQTFGVDRLKYPMKRKGWSPDNPQGELRGKDEWERISWDEALDYVASEIRKAKETYGNASILCAANNTKVIPNVLASYGGYTQWTDSASFGAFNENVAVIGLPLMGLGNSYDRLQMAKSEYVVLYGCNPSWASGGTPSWYFRHAQEAGVQFVFVGPEYNVTASMLDARWIRVRPGSDTAFLLAVAYEMMAADEAAGGSVIDQEFLDTHCVGYDAEHMPEDATLNENFKDYVQGAYDGTPKTAEWASEICGTPVEDIRWYAELMGKENKVGILHSFAAARCNNAESLPQLFYTIGAMGGHFSGEGHCIGSAYQGNAGNTGFSMFNPGTNMNPTVPNTEVIETLRAPEAWDAILQGTYRYTGNFSMYAGQYAPAEQRDIDIHVIYNENANCLQTWPGVMKGIEAFRKMDFVVTQGHFLNAVASYSDIVLPVTTVWEREDTSSGLNMFQREFIYLPKKVVDPLYEAQDDQWVAYELAKRLGLDADALFP